jgi:predicted DNA repair protein MutK
LHLFLRFEGVHGVAHAAAHRADEQAQHHERRDQNETDEKRGGEERLGRGVPALVQMKRAHLSLEPHVASAKRVPRISAA